MPQSWSFSLFHLVLLHWCCFYLSVVFTFLLSEFPVTMNRKIQLKEIRIWSFLLDPGFSAPHSLLFSFHRAGKTFFKGHTCPHIQLHQPTPSPPSTPPSTPQQQKLWLSLQQQPCQQQQRPSTPHLTFHRLLRPAAPTSSPSLQLQRQPAVARSPPASTGSQTPQQWREHVGGRGSLSGSARGECDGLQAGGISWGQPGGRPLFKDL